MAASINFSAALATWKELNLSELQKKLDGHSEDIFNSNKDSLMQRKELAEKTKQFKKMPDEEKLVAYKGILRAYQTEIDNLTKRSKAAENAFMTVYKAFAEAPDPYPLLEAAVDQTVKIAEARDFEAELQRVKEENTELKKRVNELANVEAAKKKVDAKLEQLESKMEDMVKEKVLQKENELNATYDERLRNYEEREQDLRRQITLTKNQLHDLRTSNDTTQAKLLDHSQRQDQEVVSKLAEVDMIVADLERANSRVASVERRNELLRAEIESLKSNGGTSERVVELEDQVRGLESEIETLSGSLEAQKATTRESTASAHRQIDELTKELSKTTADTEQLRHKLKQYADYEEIKRELEIMKYVEFYGMEEELEDGDETNGFTNGQPTYAHQSKTLEALLAIKNKRILEELTKFRILHGELEASLQATKDSLSAKEAELENEKSLTAKLENDLLSMDVHKSKAAAGDRTPVDSGSAADVLSDLMNKASTDLSVRSTPVPFTSSADSSILPIVTSQRDRFRQRNAELEEELRKQFQIISELRAEIKSLQSDNLKLYEKVRYMQSYREGRVTTQLDPLPGPSSSAGASSSSTLKMDDLGKYQAKYEAAMNPFEAFRGREANRAYQSLNPVERGVLVMTRQILGNRRARMFFICYAILLHVTAFWTTYECAITSGSQVVPRKGPY